MLSEILDTYRGAKAKAATDVTKLPTICAAIMLPSTLIVGFFGMNVADRPLGTPRMPGSSSLVDTMYEIVRMPTRSNHRDDVR